MILGFRDLWWCSLYQLCLISTTKPTEIINGITLHDELQLSTKRETLAQLKRQINAVGNNSRLLARGYFAVFAQ